MTQKTRLFSGIQPTGALHIGNYLGAIKNFVALQEHYDDVLYCVVDQHAITVQQDPKELIESIYIVTAAFIASGVDPQKAIIFNQSKVPAHAQMAWIFQCVARLGWLNRMTQFKEKAGKNKEKASVGLYSYPILMAADILSYQATHVPVGADQKQHIELARDIAVRFNLEHADSDFFPLPEPVFEEYGTRIMSLRDGTKKMSKSDISDYSRINLMDDDDLIATKFKKAKTDSEGMPTSIDDLEARPELKNLYALYAALTGQNIDHVCTYFSDKNFSFLKNTLADAVISTISPIREKMKKLLEDKQYLQEILTQGAQKADHLSQPILKEVYNMMGFI